MNEATYYMLIWWSAIAILAIGINAWAIHRSNKLLRNEPKRIDK